MMEEYAFTMKIYQENIKKHSFFQNSKLSEIPITISILQASTFDPKINLPKVPFNLKNDPELDWWPL